MSSNKILWTLVIVNLVATVGLGAYILTPRSGGSSSAELSGGEGQISAYIKDNPKEIIDAVNAYMAGEQDRSNAASLESIKSNKDFLENGKIHPVLGNPKGDVTLVEFLDYNCGYCKKAYPVVMEAIQKDPKLRVVLIEIPILHETSALAAQWALAAHKLGGYEKFHQQLMENTVPISAELLATFAKTAGLDVDKMKEAATSGEIVEQVGQNLSKAQEMGINGTPGFIIGDNVIRGFVEYPGLKSAIDEARK